MSKFVQLFGLILGRSSAQVVNKISSIEIILDNLIFHMSTTRSADLIILERKSLRTYRKSKRLFCSL